MLVFAVRRLLIAVLTIVIVTALIFSIVNGNKIALRAIAVAELGGMTPIDQQDSWVEKNILTDPMPVRYINWLTGFVVGDWGYSNVFRQHIIGYDEQEGWGVINTRLAATGMLAFWVFITMIPLALIVGVAAGVREGSLRDRTLSVLSIVTTATPEYVSGVIFAVILASRNYHITQYIPDIPQSIAQGQLLFFDKPVFKAVANLDRGWDFHDFFLPALTMMLYGFGYIARMTRASMTEVMASQYIRTAILKGLPRHRVIFTHALRNALVAPFTVIMLQFPWLLTGVVVVEVMFSFKGFGWTLNEAAKNMDYHLIMACSVISIVVVLATQLISDIGYILLNPRLRFR